MKLPIKFSFLLLSFLSVINAASIASSKLIQQDPRTSLVSPVEDLKVPKPVPDLPNKDEPRKENPLLLNVDPNTQKLDEWLLTLQSDGHLSPTVHRKVICFPKKGCIDISDVGIHPF